MVLMTNVVFVSDTHPYCSVITSKHYRVTINCDMKNERWTCLPYTM